MKKVLKCYIFPSFIQLLAFFSIFLSGSFFSFDNGYNVTYNISQKLCEESNDIYNRCVIGISTSNTYSDYLVFEEKYNQKMYLKSSTFSIGSISIAFNGEDIDCFASEFDLVKNDTSYVLQDLKFLNGFGLNKNNADGIIISSLFAQELCEKNNIATINELVNLYSFSYLENKEYRIIAIYDSNNNYKCCNQYYKSFDNVVLFNSSDNCLQSRENIKYYFTICSIWSISKDCYSAVRTFSNEMFFPDLSVNNLANNSIKLKDFVNKVKNNKKVVPTLLGVMFVLLLAVFSSIYVKLIFVSKKIVSNRWQKNIFLTFVVSFASLIVFTKLFPYSIYMCSKHILIVNNTTGTLFIVLLVAIVAFLFAISRIYSRESKYAKINI